MHNPACTVCHGVLDPVAGAFQNYSDSGFYRNQRGGLDSLDDSYKVAYWNSGEVFEIEAASWAERQTFSITAWLNQDSRLILRHRNNHWCDDNGCEALGRDLRLDELAVRDAESGALVYRVEWEVLDEHCYGGQYNAGTGEDDHYQWWGWDCMEIPLNLPKATYVIEVVAWADRAGDELAEIAIGATPHQEGDTWVPRYAHSGFQWRGSRRNLTTVYSGWRSRSSLTTALQRQPSSSGGRRSWAARSLSSPRTQQMPTSRVCYWPPTPNTQRWNGWPTGFGMASKAVPTRTTSRTCSWKSCSSKWFRADAVTDTDPVRHTALHDAGARRLLTPEELARKTDAVTGIQWGRSISLFPWEPLIQRRYNALTRTYRLLYGSIDSDGVTERARDTTSVMAGVARRHAAEMSCPVVVRELYLLPDGERRLFGRLDPGVTPVSEFSGTFEIAAASRSKMETFSVQGHLTAGEKTVSLAFLNDYWHETKGDRNILLDRLTVRQGNAVVYRYEMENLDHPVDCHHIEQNAFHLSGSGQGCVLAVPVTIPSDGTYQIDVSAWGTHAGDELPRLSVLVESDAEDSGRGCRHPQQARRVA